eukprot:3040420-Pyramimonas_sp.AAC.1
MPEDLKARCEEVVPRALIDCVSFQWIGNDPGRSVDLFHAVRWFIRRVQPLGHITQADASGCVASTKPATKVAQKLGTIMNLQCRKHMRNLGCELA